METFFALLDTYVQHQIDPVYHFFTGLAMVVCLAALVTSVSRANFSGDVTGMIRHVVAVMLVSLCIMFMRDWLDLAERIASAGLADLDADPRDTHEKFGELLSLTRDGAALPSVILGIHTYSFPMILGWLGWFTVWVAWVIQEFALALAISVAPLMVSLLLLQATQGIGVRFIIGIIALALLPLGWVVFDIFTKFLLRLAESVTDFDRLPLGIGTGASILIDVLVSIAGVYTFISTLFAPIAMYRLFNSGASIGVSAVQSMQASASTGISQAIGGATMGGFVGGAAGAAAGAGIGLVSGSVTGATGTRGAVMPAVMGAAAMTGDVTKRANDVARAHK